MRFLDIYPALAAFVQDAIVSSIFRQTA